MHCCLEVKGRCERWIRDYDSLQYVAVVLLYVQIGCSLVGSLGALYNGLLLTDLGIALFALIAIESSSQSLGRTYAVLLIISILLDVVWFILFSKDIWNLSSDDRSAYFIISVKLTLVMQIIGFSVRFSSSFLWIQIYRLGITTADHSILRDDSADYDHLQSSLLTPSSSALPRQCSDSDVVLGGSIYDPSYYSSLFENIRHSRLPNQNQTLSCGENGSASGINTPNMRLHSEASFEAINEDSEGEKVEKQ